MDLGIQYLRGIAAVLVIFAHFFHGKLFYGAIGVDIFFLLSGHVMRLTAGRYVNRKRVFILNRIIRIYPLYLAISFPFFAIMLGAGSPLQILKSLFFFGGDLTTYEDPILFSGWSLAFEMLFYGIVILTARSTRRTSLTLLALGLVGFLPIENASGYLFNSFMLLFLVGFHLEDLQRIRLPIRAPWVHLVLSIGLLVIVTRFSDIHGPTVTHWTDAIYIQRQFIFLTDQLAVPRVLFWGIPSLYFVYAFRSFVAGMRPLRILGWLGQISYSIYLVHTALHMVFLVPAKGAFGPLSPTTLLVLELFLMALILPLSHVTYELIEKRGTRALKRLLLPVRSAPTASP